MWIVTSDSFLCERIDNGTIIYKVLGSNQIEMDDYISMGVDIIVLLYCAIIIIYLATLTSCVSYMMTY